MKAPVPTTTRHRAVVVSLLLVLALAASALASAAPPGGSGTRSVSISVNSTTCLITVDYSWQGFKGKNLVAEYVVLDDVAGSFDLGIAYKYVEGVSGSSGGGPITFQFTPGGNNPAGKFGAIGRLGKFDRFGQFKETQPAAQVSTTGPFNTGGCGNPVS